MQESNTENGQFIQQLLSFSDTSLYAHTHQLGKLDFVRDTQKGWHLLLAIVARENISQTASYVSTSSSYQSPMAIYHNYL